MTTTHANMYLLPVLLTNNLGETTYQLKVQLPFCKERTPNMKIELIQAKFTGDAELPSLAVRMSESPDDFYSLDNKGAVLGIVSLKGGATSFHYALDHDSTPAYVISSGTRELSVSHSNNLTGEVLSLLVFAKTEFSSYSSCPILANLMRFSNSFPPKSTEWAIKTAIFN
jgi:hypothetical protein